jgi:hypothetical protein
MAALQRTGVIKSALLQPWMDEWRASLSTGDLARASSGGMHPHELWRTLTRSQRTPP